MNLLVERHETGVFRLEERLELIETQISFHFLPELTHQTRRATIIENLLEYEVEIGLCEAQTEQVAVGFG